ncbi:inositol oxygenase isoform X3 [Phyllopteryx taeniolatus]|uniref:inositol oxygenase isoform X3 n=1 Tax=Phyllopteryx taeniolatus TaxID=161469 RepID=UPI002AD30B1E|nr:inositol oxygenase isoform X3 [Phyllopteryx taeniolatus]
MKVINLGPDPSLVYQPNMAPKTTKEDYRNFEHLEWSGCSHAEMPMMDAVMSLDQLVDESDPDVDFPNSFHAFQTAEGIRKEHPDNDWFQLVGLIHDVGKVMALWDEPQWAVVGDTFPVGCTFQNSIVFRDSTFQENPDDTNPSYNSKYGIYKPNIGLDSVLMSWGHDGSPQRVILFHGSLSPESSSLPPTALMSSLTTSINLLFGLPLALLPGSSILIILLPIYSLSPLWTCPNH